MATNIVLLHYNNYANRIVTKESSVANYLTLDSNAVTCTDINFVPGDGVTTSLILGYGTNSGTIFTGDKDNFDYLLVYETVTENQVTTNVIKSRWFIIETDRTNQAKGCLVFLTTVTTPNM